MPNKKPQLEESWLAILHNEFEEPYMAQLRAFLLDEEKYHRGYSRGPLIFNAFWKTPFHKVKVVILGQDPYHGPNQAHGLSFSVQRGIHPPPSLQNIFKELEADTGAKIPNHGELTHWADQGVLLLNTVLTVRHQKAHSHRGRGWEQFTDRVIRELSSQREDLVFLFWGKAAQQKSPLIDGTKHLILSSPHPSPYSADRGFFGSKPFSRINAFLQKKGKDSINWEIPA